MSTHRFPESQVLIVKTGRLRVTLNREDPVTVELGPYDTLSVPPGAWRRLESVGDDPALVVVLTGGDGRIRPEWEPSVVDAAHERGVAVDANGYLAPAALVR